MLREELLHAKEYYGDDVDHDLFVCKLNNAVAKYTQAARDIKKRLVDARLAKIRVQHDYVKVGGWGPSGTLDKAYATDDVCDWHSKTYEHWE